MGRYGGTGGEFEPGSDGAVLRNRLGIVSSREAERVETRLLRDAQTRSFTIVRTNTRFSVELLRALHRAWLGPVYPFAGEIRRVDLSKGLVRFAPVAYLETTLRDLDGLLAEHTPCAGMPRERLIAALARVHGETILAHPFREGNGRLTRWTLDLMANQAGFGPLSWPFADGASEPLERYYPALRRAFLQEYGPLEELTDRALDAGTARFPDPPP